MQKIPENVMTVGKVVLPLVVIIILFITAGQLGFGEISKIRAQISKTSNENGTLTQKIDILRNISEIGEAGSNTVVSALPDSNPSLLVLSQIKTLAGTNNLTISSPKGGSLNPDTKELSSVNISFSLSGSRDQIKLFLDGISSLAPLMVVDKIKIVESTPGISLASIVVKSFESPFPEKIPAISDPITALTSVEEQTLQELGNLSQPMFSVIPPSEGGKVDPFSI